MCASGPTSRTTGRSTNEYMTYVIGVLPTLFEYSSSDRYHRKTDVYVYTSGSSQVCHSYVQW